jgi:cell division protease FtsH
MFTEKAMAIISQAKVRACTLQRERVDLESVLSALGEDQEGAVRLAECVTDGEVEALRARCPSFEERSTVHKPMEPDDDLRAALEKALELASGEGVPDRMHPGFIALGHLVCGVAMSPASIRILGDGCKVITREEALSLLTKWISDSGGEPSLGGLVAKLRALRADLFATIFGQDHAIQAFIDGLYNARVTAQADEDRKRPEGVFVFAGPPGVGKTFLAETAAARLERPFRRFDMTSFTDHQMHLDLVGMPPSYKDAKPGALTGFVAEHPDAILLFDEIEKAHLNAIQLFYQILDAGRLEDKFMSKNVSFRDCLIIFTTNAGKSLYDDPNRMGIGVANSAWHKRTILSALENEKNPSNRQPAFPPAICSRLGQGYPVMFNHLGVNELEKIVDAEMRRTEKLLARQYFKTFSHDERLPMALVFREGARVDARQLRSDAEKFVKAELFRFCSRYADERIEQVLSGIDTVQYVAPPLEDGGKDVMGELFAPATRPKVLLIAHASFASLCRKKIKNIDWVMAASDLEAAEKLSVEDVDMVLLDLWFGAERSQDDGDGADYMSYEAEELKKGRAVLQRLRERFPSVPVFLLSLHRIVSRDKSIDSENRSGAEWLNTGSLVMTLEGGMNAGLYAAIGEDTPHRPVDDELFHACVQAGGARGLVSTDFGVDMHHSRQEHASAFSTLIADIHQKLYREAKASALAKERKLVSFETVSEIDTESRTLHVRSRNFKISRALDASDAGALVDDVMRPSTRFDDVLGATEAKKALQFIVDWLRTPKKFRALGLRPPKGILLTGPPGTGKTMLARALAGEADCAFLEKAATSFVTIWQGSGPQNIRDLFALARKYAPAIVFIDEIDAIGGKRVGSIGGAGKAAEETLNALLTEMDGFSGVTQSDVPIIVLAATNMEDLLDDALKRRFDRVIEVDKPDYKDRYTFLKKVMEERTGAAVSDKVLQRLAGQTAGMTIAHLERIVQEAGVMAAQAGESITDAILEEAFEKARMGSAKEMPDRATLERIARHEAGHAMIACLGGNWPVQVTIVGRGGAGGFMEREADEKRIIYTKPEIEQLIREAMAGRAAELIYYGDEEGLSTGVGSDLRHATRWAVRMIQEFGMDPVMGQCAVADITGNRAAEGVLNARVARLVRQIVDKQLQEAHQLLKTHRSTLDELVEALLLKNRLTREELEAFLRG